MGVDSLAPRQRYRLSVEDEAALMNRGRSRQIWGTAVVLALIVGSGGLVLRYMELQQRRNDAYGAVRSADDEHAGEFIRCALPAVQSTQLGTSAAMLTMIERTSDRLGGRYAALLGQCAAELATLDAALQQVSVPKDAKDELHALRASVIDLRRAWTTYQAHVAGGNTDYVKALPLMEKAAMSWSAYAERRKALEAVLLPANTF
jgi:hypothetical protein